MKQSTLVPTVLLIGFLSLLASSLHAETVQSSYYHTFENMHTFSTFYPRTENSEGEKATLQYIRRRIEEIGVSYRTSSLDSYEGFHSFSSSIRVSIEGSRNDSLYFVFPLNHPPESAVDESYAAGLALALDFVEEISRGPMPPVNIEVLFLGAEKGQKADYRLGSRAFLQDFSPSAGSAFVYIDLAELPSELEVLPAGTGRVGPAWMVDRMHEALFASESGYHMSATSFQIHRLGLNDRPCPIDPYLESGFPAVYLRGNSNGGEDASPIPFSELTAYLLRFTEQFDTGIPDRWDSHYFFFKLDRYLLLFGESFYAVLILLILSLTLLYPFLRPKRFIKYARSILRHFSVVPILFGFMLLFLYLSTLLLDGVMSFRGIDSLWRAAPLTFLALKVSAAAILFSLSQYLLTRIHLRRLRGSFYSASALVFLLFDIILLTIVDISLTFYGMWIFFFAFLFTGTRTRTMKVVYLLLSFSLAVVLLTSIFLVPHYGAVRGVLLSEWRGNLIIALNLLPFMLMLIRIRMLFHHPNPRITRWIILATELVLVAVVSVLTWNLLTFQPYAEPRKQPLHVREQISVAEANRTIRIKSPLDIGELDLSGESYRLEKKIEATSFFSRLPFPETHLSMEIEKSGFLGRAIYRATLSPVGNPEEIEIRLQSEEAIVLYDCSFPVSQSPDRRSLTVHIGRNPPVPLSFSFTVPAGFSGKLIAQSTYYTAPYSAELPTERFEVDYRLHESLLTPITGRGE